VRRALLLVLFLGLALGARTVLACPGCKEAAAAVDHTSGDAGAGSLSRISQGFSYTIYAMMGLPFVLTGAGAWWIYAAHRRALRAGAKSGTAADSPPGESTAPTTTVP